MANYYVHFSESVPNLSPAELRWLRNAANKLAAKDDPPGFEYCFVENKESGIYLWLYSEESGDPEQAALFVQKFLKKFRPETCWSLTYAETCSTPRIGAFGGGGIFVTARKIESFNIVGEMLQHQHRFDFRRAIVSRQPDHKANRSVHRPAKRKPRRSRMAG